MKFERRLRQLETKLISEPVILFFADGSTRELRGGGDFVLRLFRGVFGSANLGPTQNDQLNLIRRCIGSKEPSAGRLVELLHCFLCAQDDGQADS
jgi:hypothetical protein